MEVNRPAPVEIRVRVHAHQRHILRRDFLPEDLQPLLAAAGIDGCVSVQARQMLEETRWLLELADRHPWIRDRIAED